MGGRAVDLPPRYFAFLPGSSVGKDSACNAGDLGSIPGSGRSPGEREWQPTPVFLQGESRGQRSLAGLQSMELQRDGED